MLAPGQSESQRPSLTDEERNRIQPPPVDPVRESFPDVGRWEEDEDAPPRTRPLWGRVARVFGWLTCQGQLREGTRRLLIVLSVPLFLVYLVPGVVFWLLVWGFVWVRAGYRLDRQRQDWQTRLPEDEETLRQSPDEPR